MNWLWQIFDPATISAFFTQFQAEMQQPAFWVALGKIMWINILLSGDNALVIAMACRGLPPRQRFWGMVLGAGVAVFLRIIFTGIVVTLMALPFLKLVGGLALLVIAAKLLVPENEDEGGVDAASHLWAAVQIVAIADIVMSLDNVIAVAAAANGSIPLLVIGLAISVPLIVAGAALIMALLTRLPALVWAGAGLLGWVAGEVMATDPALQPSLHAFFNGPVGVGLDGVLTSLGLAPQFANGGHGGEVVLGHPRHHRGAGRGVDLGESASCRGAEHSAEAGGGRASSVQAGWAKLPAAPSTLGFISHASLRALTRANPSVAEVLWRDTLIDSAIFREWIVNVGQRPAASRLAHTVVELRRRLAVTGRATGDTFDMPLTQEQISEALGITPVHANRIIRQLRDDNIVDISRGRVTVLDEANLAELAQFDDRYLHQDPSFKAPVR